MNDVICRDVMNHSSTSSVLSPWFLLPEATMLQHHAVAYFEDRRSRSGDL